MKSGAGIAQLVEHRTEDPGVPSSDLGPGTRNEGDGKMAVALSRDSASLRAFQRAGRRFEAGAGFVQAHVTASKRREHRIGVSVP